MKYLYSLLTCILVFGSCKKDHKVSVPDFEVHVEKKTIQVDEPVEFIFSGVAEQVSFYSGEPLNNYEFKEGRVSETLGIEASFATNVTYNSQPNMLSVWTSTDYNGGGTYEDIQNATWTDVVSSEFDIAPEDNPWGAGNNLPSGTVNLIDATEEGQPLYVAFKYENNPASGVARNWYIYQFKSNAETLFASESLISSLSGFTIVYDDHYNSDVLKTSTISASGSYLMFTTPTAIRPFESEIWAVSPAMELTSTDLGPDRPVAIKGFRDTMLKNYNHVYSEPGEYTATFVVNNTTVYGNEEVIKQIKITVTE